LRVIESPYLTQSGTPYEQRRTWRERLFTRPWHPLRKTRIVVPQVPYQGVVKIDDRMIVVHPAIVRQLLDTFGAPSGSSRTGPHV